MKTVEYNGVKLKLVEDDMVKLGCEQCYFDVNAVCRCPLKKHPKLSCRQNGIFEHWEEVKKDLTNKNK